MSFVNITDFAGHLNIPNTNNPDVASLLTSEITRLEDLFFNEVFGYEFQKAMLADQSNPIYDAILSGSEFSQNSILYKWVGVKEPLIRYIYYYFVKDNESVLTGSGFTTSNNENSMKVQAVTKLNRVYNELVDLMQPLKGYMYVNQSAYGDYRLPINYIDYLNDFAI